jgi:hypothetical protein
VVVTLSPPPLDYDKDIPGLKRIEYRMKGEDIPANSHVGFELTNQHEKTL